MEINKVNIPEKLKQIHDGDIQQLKVIFSEKPRVIVEAPAGYGKTTTMVSRIAYLYSCGLIPNPKKLLGLTFSVNAALKIKKDVASKLPLLLKDDNNPISLKDSIDITNYHGFCKKILKKYGYLITSTPLLKYDPNLFRAIGEGELKREINIRNYLLNNEIEYLLSIENLIKKSKKLDQEKISKYVNIITNKLLPHKIITHTSLVLYTILLFDLFPEVQKFYQNYYPVIVVDEFQDTNYIAWELIHRIINDRTHLLFLGDSLQRIYGFIGAVPDIMEIARNEFGMEKIELSKNYRFMSNENMLKLDKNIRINAQNEFKCHPLDIANIPGFYGKNQAEECNQVCTAIKQILKNDNKVKIAILFRGRNNNVGVMQQKLEENKIDYFYGMFTDEDDEYIEFHKKCQLMFIHKFGSKKGISNLSLAKFINDIKDEYITDNSTVINSLLILLEAFIIKIKEDYKDLQPEEKYLFIMDVFENGQLKQAMEYVDANVVLSTVHGAKGLEWDYVVISDLEPWLFPSFSCCQLCGNKYIKEGAKCSFPEKFDDGFIANMVDELSVFYVAVTRARKQVYVSASASRLNNDNQIKNSKYSCYISVPGIKLVKAEL